MLTCEFDYDLPPELIAQEAVEPRDASRLLVVHRAAGRLEHRRFCEIGAYLRPGDLLVANETRVIPARLAARKVPSGGRVELLLLHQCADRLWEALVKGRRVPVGQRLALEDPAQAAPEGIVEAFTPSGGRLIRFDAPLQPHLERLGTVPLPPYIQQPITDPERYQTVYARVMGSAAAPTAGLHFTPELLACLRTQGIAWASVLLHIGLDTFRPVSEERVADHVMHSEYGVLSAETAERVAATRAAGGRVVAVGTTSVRVLETAAQGADGGMRPWEGHTRLYIHPGYRFRAVDALITNFHLPRSTLLMLVSALAGRELILRAYEEAVQRRYRFYSLGDAMLIL